MDETPQEPSVPPAPGAGESGATQPIEPAGPTGPMWTWGASPPPSIPPSDQPPPPGRGRGRFLLIVGLAVVLVGGAAGGVALLAGGGGGKSAATTPPGPSSPTTAPSPTPILIAPSDLTVETSAFSVTLSWAQLPGGSHIDGYTLTRSGHQLADVVAPATTYTDDTVVPGKTYTYELVARGSGLVTDPVSATAETPIPSLASARVEGDFNVKVSLSSETGFTSYPEHLTLGWHLKPKCAAGPCNVVWTDLNEGSFKATLTRKKATYSGSDKGDFGGMCGSTHVESTLTIEFHVTKAKAINGEWRASKLVGTLVDSSPSQFGCVSATANLNIVLTL